MKLLRLPEGHLSEFEAVSPQEAIELARRKLGDYVELRCWRVRHGGLFGFFARESFVAGIKPPNDKASDSGLDSAGLSNVIRSTSLGVGDKHQRHFYNGENIVEYSRSLSELVESTNDELDLGSSFISSLAFKDILAEAEAAIESAIRTPKVSSEPKPHKKTRPVTSEIDFFDEMRKLGVGAQHLSFTSPHSLDAVLEAFQLLPKSPKIPSSPGSVIVIVGTKGDIRLTGEVVARSVGIPATEIIQAETVDSVFQKVSQRRRSKKVSVVLLEAPMQSKNLDPVQRVLLRIKPSYVLGSLAASSKRADVVDWSNKFKKLDAIALNSLENTATPGEMLGEMPIAFLDTMPATPLHWLITLLRCLEKG